jgi:hypothetical protein
LLRRRGTIRGLLRNIHRRLDRRRMMLLLLGGLLLLRCHIRLRSVLLELMLLITTGHVVLVLVGVVHLIWLMS